MEEREPDPPAQPQPRRHRALTYRSRHRAAQDDLASAESPHPPELTIPDDPLIPRGDPELVTTAPAFDGLVAHLRAAGSFAYDTEFIGEQSYVPRICLIQVATADRVALIDPFAEIDVRPFWELLADGAVEKVVHAGLQDLEPVWRFLGRPAANIFDTQIAAGFAARAYPIALWRLVEEFVGVPLGKSPKFSQWDRRPLTRVQLAYAANDVRFLPSLRAHLGQRLEALGHAAWAAQECNALTDPALYRFDIAQQLQRMRGSERLRRRELGILQALIAWRDQAAREADLPPRTFLKDGILLDMSRNPVTSMADLDKVWGLPRPVEAAHGQTLIDLTAAVLAAPVTELPPVSRSELSMDEQAAVDGLWAAAIASATQKQVDPAVLGSRSELARLIRQLVHEKQRPDSRFLRGWRRELLGDAIDVAGAALIEARDTRRKKHSGSHGQASELGRGEDQESPETPPRPSEALDRATQDEPPTHPDGSPRSPDQ